MTRRILCVLLVLIFSIKAMGQVKDEMLNIDSVLLNNNVPFKTSVKFLKDKLGLPDSTSIQKHDCAGYFNFETVTVYYYGEAIFESFKDTVVLQTIRFREGGYKLKTSQLTLDNKTTLDNFKHIYPISTKESYLSFDSSDGKTYRIVRIRPQVKFDDEWVLKFYNGLLVEIEYWIPC